MFIVGDTMIWHAGQRQSMMRVSSPDQSFHLPFPPTCFMFTTSCLQFVSLVIDYVYSDGDGMANTMEDALNDEGNFIKFL